MPADQPLVSTNVPTAPKLSHSAFLGIVWGGFSIATIFVICRSGLRYRTFRRFYIDDLFVLVSWLMVLATSVSWQLLADDMYLNNAVSRGVQMPPQDFVERSETFLKASAAIVFLFYSTLWSIKLSFLFFFRRLYINIAGRWMIFWWAITAATIATWAVCVGNIDYKCLVSPIAEIAMKCSNDRAVRYQRITLILNCVLDVVTDVLITCIPFTVLWKVRISTRRKLALAGLFSVTVFTMVFAIIRVSLITSSAWREDMTWLYNWSNIECYAALIVSSLGSFRSLFRSDSDKKPSRPSGAPYTIGSPNKKARLDSFAHMFTSSLRKTASDSQDDDIIELKDPVRSQSDPASEPSIYQQESLG